MNWSYVWSTIALVASVVVMLIGIDLITKPAMLPWSDRLFGVALFALGLGMAALCMRVMT